MLDLTQLTRLLLLLLLWGLLLLHRMSMLHRRLVLLLQRLHFRIRRPSSSSSSHSDPHSGPHSGPHFSQFLDVDLDHLIEFVVAVQNVGASPPQQPESAPAGGSSLAPRPADVGAQRCRRVRPRAAAPAADGNDPADVDGRRRGHLDPKTPAGAAGRGGRATAGGAPGRLPVSGRQRRERIRRGRGRGRRGRFGALFRYDGDGGRGEQAVRRRSKGSLGGRTRGHRLLRQSVEVHGQGATADGAPSRRRSRLTMKTAKRIGPRMSAEDIVSQSFYSRMILCLDEFVVCSREAVASRFRRLVALRHELTSSLTDADVTDEREICQTIDSPLLLRTQLLLMIITGSLSRSEGRGLCS